MVTEVNKEERTITVVFENMELDSLLQAQKSLIKMMQRFNWKDFALDAEDSIYDVCSILESLLPSCEQMKNGLSNLKNPIELPEALSEAQTESIKQAFTNFNLPGAIRPEFLKNNAVYQALISI